MRRDGKNSSEIVEKLRTEKYIRETYGVDDAEAWARAYVETLDQDEKNKIHKVLIPFQTDIRVPLGKQFSYNAGYLFLQKIYRSLSVLAEESDMIQSQLYKNSNVNYKFLKKSGGV